MKIPVNNLNINFISKINKLVSSGQLTDLPVLVIPGNTVVTSSLQIQGNKIQSLRFKNSIYDKRNTKKSIYKYFFPGFFFFNPNIIYLT